MQSDVGTIFGMGILQDVRDKSDLVVASSTRHTLVDFLQYQHVGVVVVDNPQDPVKIVTTVHSPDAFMNIPAKYSHPSFDVTSNRRAARDPVF